MIKQIYAVPTAIILMALLCCCVIKPPHEEGTFHKNDLVELVTLDPSIKLDIRYATSNNFTGKPVYTEARAFLQREAALALVRVNEKLKKQGYGILVYDGYRPWSITKIFWQVTPKSKKAFVANPKIGSKHNRGCAVDVSLYSLATGKAVEMATDFDDMNDLANIYYKGGTAEQQHLNHLLIITMDEEGFTVLSKEWWHFDYKGWQKYRICDVPFVAL
jgi:D-alanyl-D-alanine dipeptidase